MKIGIMTCWQPDDNYGTQIQGFALQKYLEKIGNDVFLIQYHRFDDVLIIKRPFWKILKVLNPYLLLHFIKNQLDSKNQKKETLSHNRNAPEFRKKYLHLSKDYYTFDELSKQPPEADAYIVGSDQVWNIHYLQKNNLNAHFLNFGKYETKRISYAASFGFSEGKLNEKFAVAVKPLLSHFDAISVREKNGLEILKKIGIENAVHVCDPTFLISPDEYLEFFKDENVELPENDYVFVYELSAASSLSIKKIKNWAYKQGLDVIYVTGHGKCSSEKRIFPAVPQWMKLIANARYVITNSFHGTVFSLFFHKPVAVFSLKGCAKTTNSRLDTLNMMIGRNLIIHKSSGFEKILLSNFDWDFFEIQKKTLREKGISFLSNALAGK